jgi:hypothetical protein
MKLFAVLSSLALAVLGTAIPSSSSSASTARSAFSFTDWVDSVIADPSTALSPEEAVAAFNTSVVSFDHGDPPWGKCEVVWNYPATVDDAVWCINDLAGRGKSGEICNVNDIGPLAQCTHGFMAVWTERRFKWAPTSVNWCVSALERDCEQIGY